jgi:hypothetical protein
MIAGGRLPGGEAARCTCTRAARCCGYSAGRSLFAAEISGALAEKVTWSSLLTAWQTVSGSTDIVLEVVAEDNIGTLYPGVSDGGEAELVEAYRVRNGPRTRRCATSLTDWRPDV